MQDADSFRRQFAEKKNPVRDADFARGRFQPRPVAALSGKREICVGEQRKYGDRGVELLEPMEACGAADELDVLGQAELGSCRSL